MMCILTGEHEPLEIGGNSGVGICTECGAVLVIGHPLVLALKEREKAAVS